MPEYELTYFNARGLAEPIRLLLAYVGADWKDIRIPHAGPGSPIPQEIKEKCNFGQVPLLEFRGHRLNQSATILRFLARKFNLAGKDEIEAAHVEEVGDTVMDFFTMFRPIFAVQDESEKAALIKTTVATATDKYLRVLNTMAEKNNGYTIGGSLTWGDLAVVQAIDSIQRVFKLNLLHDLPALKKLTETVYNAKGIKEYLAQRPETEF